MRQWNEFVAALEKQWGASSIEKWIRPLKIAKFDAANLYLEAQEPFQVDWFEEHVRPLLKNDLVNPNTQKPIRVHLSFGPPLKKQTAKPTFPVNIAPDRVDPEMTLETYVPSEPNAMAYKLIQGINTSPFNLIYLYGPKSSGKTHLLMAAAHLLAKTGRKVFFVKAETFTSHVVHAIRQGFMQQFRKNYREIDALLVDDLDIFSRKDATQEEFFHTFNTLHTAGKQLILTASHPPSQLSDIEPRLISRFEWGIVASVGKTDPLSILEMKNKMWKLSFSQEVLQILAQHFSLNPSLALQALSLRAKGMKELSEERIFSLLHDLMQQQQEKALDPEKIVKMVATQYGIRSEDLLGKAQSREVALPRQIAMYLCRKKLGFPYQKIGRVFDRDHSTVMASIQLIEKKIEEKELNLNSLMQSDRLP